MQPAKAPSPILITLSGTITLVRNVDPHAPLSRATQRWRWPKACKDQQYDYPTVNDVDWRDLQDLQEYIAKGLSRFIVRFQLLRANSSEYS